MLGELSTTKRMSTASHTPATVVVAEVDPVHPLDASLVDDEGAPDDASVDPIVVVADEDSSMVSCGGAEDVSVDDAGWLLDEPSSSIDVDPTGVPLTIGPHPIVAMIDATSMTTREFMPLKATARVGSMHARSCVRYLDLSVGDM
jgi:hypothetical protein